MVIPIFSPALWFYWDSNYYIFGGDTPTWAAFQNLIEWHFPYLWDEFDGAGHPFANNAALPTAFYFWIFFKLGVSALFAQMLFFILLSAISTFGIYRIGKLFFGPNALVVFVFVSAAIYLLNPFGFYGENRRIFTSEFAIAYYLLPLFVSYLLTAIENTENVLRESLLAALTSVLLHNFNLIPAVSYVGISYLSIALSYSFIQRNKITTILQFFLIFLSISLALLAYHAYAMFQYFSVSSFASDISNIVQLQSSADLLVNTLMFGGYGIDNPWWIITYSIPIFFSIAAFYWVTPRRLVMVFGVLMLSSLFFMDAGRMATKVFGITDLSASLYGIFRFPHIKFTAPYHLSIAFLCAITATQFIKRRSLVFTLVIMFILFWNPRFYSTWLPIQLHQPDDWLEISSFLQKEKLDNNLPRTLKIPSAEYFKDGVGGEELARTPPMQNEGARPWMVHSAVFGLLFPQPAFSLDLSPGARLNPCVRRIFRERVAPDEMIFLLKNLGINRVLLSKNFTYQMAYTPVEIPIRMKRLVKEFQVEGLYQNSVFFENSGLQLSPLAIDSNPLIYLAGQVQHVSSGEFNNCNFFGRIDENKSTAAFYTDARADLVLSNVPHLGHAEVQFKRHSPGKYSVHLSKVTNNSTLVLVLNNTYTDWSLELAGTHESNNNFQDQRFPVNGFATAWVLDTSTLCNKAKCITNPKGGYDLDLTIKYTPQKTYQNLLYSSIFLFVFILAYLIGTTKSLKFLFCRFFKAAN